MVPIVGFITPPDAVSILGSHGVYLSAADEAEVIRRAAETDDVGELALRTCMCGVSIDGFDAYWDHIREVFSTSS